ncbi:hypothetical protein NSK_007560 [Nannochloropsis salina CCMP1776]|uniref:Adenylate kinase active site lid domain-containing protein n=1 Tax=Nannochloropsis salina CCMP1776 TaxID=1027361 RepID=A0A4D9CS72_9STRA|nr:hypothetical protein NSK_007560 [Nannochloropsis salina CCMP1776]|eukprot:TFJ80917.1 hypothetical protein NSK_007560 [Nannochloropsis salina CCMP1776]
MNPDLCITNREQGQDIITPVPSYFMSTALLRKQLPLVAAAAGLVLVGAAVLYRRKKRQENAQRKRTYEVVFVLGGPGAGKGTQCSLLVERYGLIHLSAGDLLREERKRGTELASMINTYIKEGKIVPAEVTVGLLRAAMEKAGAHAKFLIDGFPRDPGNLRCWEETMDDCTLAKGGFCT